MKGTLLLVILVFSTGQAFSQIINNPESVEFDAANDRYLVSNRSNPISIQSLIPGQAPVLFTSNVTSPAGLEILNGKLWVCDGGNIKSFDLSNGTLIDNIAVGGTFLNGITSDGTDFLFVSDFTAKKIYKVSTVSLNFTEIVANTVTSPNGMWYDGANNRVIFVNWGTNAPIKSIDLSNYNVSTAATTTLGNCDGIGRDAGGNYFVSAWNQQGVYRFDSNLSNPVAVVNGLTQPADIYYNQSNDTLVVPQTSADLVSFHYFGTAALTEMDVNRQLLIYPNPAQVSFSIELPVGVQKIENIKFINSIGQEVTFEYSLTNDVLIVETIGQAEGLYTFQLMNESIIYSGEFLIRK